MLIFVFIFPACVDTYINICKLNVYKNVVI